MIAGIRKSSHRREERPGRAQAALDDMLAIQRFFLEEAQLLRLLAFFS